MAEKIGHGIAIITGTFAAIIFFLAIACMDSEQILPPILAMLTSGAWLVFLCRDWFIE